MMGTMGKRAGSKTLLSAPLGALSWFSLERMTRFELATLTLAMCT